MKTLKEIITGIPKEVLEYLESNTELAKTAIKSHKKDFSNNIKYIFIGFLLSLIPQIFSLLNKQSESKLLKEQFDEINGVYDNLQKDINQMRLENKSLKIQLDSLKESSQYNN
jgi:hypothetical protein